jgi:hypothetical protein
MALEVHTLEHPLTGALPLEHQTCHWSPPLTEASSLPLGHQACTCIPSSTGAWIKLVTGGLRQLELGGEHGGLHQLEHGGDTFQMALEVHTFQMALEVHTFVLAPLQP